jgi:hypothetical protein
MLVGDLRQCPATRVSERAEWSDDASDAILLHSRQDQIEVIRGLDAFNVRQGDSELLSSGLQFPLDFGERAARSGSEDSEPRC